jgi:hypothetical protein
MCSCVMSYSWHIVRIARAWTVVAGKVKVFQKVAQTFDKSQCPGGQFPDIA